MACYHPIPAWQAEGGGDVRLYPPLDTANLQLPCGKCLGCRQTRATMWAHRCTHEAKQYEHNSFLTLTYDDDHLPEEGHLQPRDLQLFLKRLRKRLHRLLARRTTPTTPGQPRPTSHASHGVLSDPRRPLRYFACGEYGEQTQRPHYHLLLFNLDLQGEQIGISHGEQLRIAHTITDTWPLGLHAIGTARPGAVAGYIAKYALKAAHTRAHGIIDPDGVWRPAAFLRVSKGIGKSWLTRFHTDLSHGYLVANGHRCAIPRYYKQKLKENYQHTYELLEHYQQQYKLTNQGDKNTPERLHDAEIIHEQKHRNTIRRDR